VLWKCSGHRTEAVLSNIGSKGTAMRKPQRILYAQGRNGMVNF